MLLRISVSVPWRGLRPFGLKYGRLHLCTFGEFPSPGGDCGLSDKCQDMEVGVCYWVSVPWRGLRSFGPHPTWWATASRSSFRPLTGIRVFRTALVLITALAIVPFPSPDGD